MTVATKTPLQRCVCVHCYMFRGCHYKEGPCQSRGLAVRSQMVEHFQQPLLVEDEEVGWAPLHMIDEPMTIA